MKTKPKHRAYIVRLDGKTIDKVFATTNEKNRYDRANSVRDSLIHHDGYDMLIDVTEER